MIGIDPSSNRSGVVMLDKQGRICEAMTVDTTDYNHAEALNELRAWCYVRRVWAEGHEVAVELPPPRVAGRRYHIEPALFAGIWGGFAAEIWSADVQLIPVGEWQIGMLGPRKSWMGSSSKKQARLRCTGLLGELVDEHQRDAYLIARWAQVRKRMRRAS